MLYKLSVNICKGMIIMNEINHIQIEVCFNISEYHGEV